MVDALLQLHADEGSPDQGKAKRLIAGATGQMQPGGNPYAHAWNYFCELGENTRDFNEFDDARRRLAHFWFRAAQLVNWGVMTRKELLDNFEPDILGKLEPFEAVAAERFRDLTDPSPWPAMELFSLPRRRTRLV